MTGPAWHARAACRGHDPDLWFPGPGQSRRREEAIRICSGCPVRVECADWAARHRPPFGVWAGVPESERDTTTARPSRWSEANLRPCGTVAAYQRHLRRGETPCEACRFEWSAATKAARQRRREAEASA